jgi:hypothetical protein
VPSPRADSCASQSTLPLPCRAERSGASSREKPAARAPLAEAGVGAGRAGTSMESSSSRGSVVGREGPAREITER